MHPPPKRSTEGGLSSCLTLNLPRTTVTQRMRWANFIRASGGAPALACALRTSLSRTWTEWPLFRANTRKRC